MKKALFQVFCFWFVLFLAVFKWLFLDLWACATVARHVTLLGSSNLRLLTTYLVTCVFLQLVVSDTYSHANTWNEHWRSVLLYCSHTSFAGQRRKCTRRRRTVTGGNGMQPTLGCASLFVPWLSSRLVRITRSFRAATTHWGGGSA